MNHSTTRSSRRRRPGSSTLEAILVLPALLALSMGVVEFGQFFYVKHTMQAASRDGARTAILSSTTHANARNVIINAMNSAGMTDQSKYTITFHNAATDAAITDIATAPKGTSIKVTVSATAGNVSLRPLGVIPASKPVVGLTTMIKE